MNKKLSALVVIAVLALSLTMFVGVASAKKGQERSTFVLLFQGYPNIAADDKVAGGNTIRRDTPFMLLGDCYVKIGDEGAVEDLSKEYLEYEGTMNFVVHTVPEQFFTVNVRETISIYSSAKKHDESTLRGTLVISATGDNRGGNGGNFVGFGTGEFEGVKIHGTSSPLLPVDGFLQLTRTGTVMGWPQ
jgi:hypothetical protein